MIYRSKVIRMKCRLKWSCIRLQNSRFFFLKISKEIGKACRKSKQSVFFSKSVNHCTRKSLFQPLIAKNYNTMRAITSWKSTWDTVLYFGINGLSMILSLWFLLHLLSKLLAIQDHTQNLEEQLWMGGRREVSIIFYRPVTRSDLKQERSFFRGSVSTFLQLVVAIVYITVVRVWFIHLPAPCGTTVLKKERGNVLSRTTTVHLEIDGI